MPLTEAGMRRHRARACAEAPPPASGRAIAGQPEDSGTATMFLRIQHDDDSSLVEVLDLPQLFDPFEPLVLGRLHAGEELQEPQSWPKARLRFPSGEPLPGCWLGPLHGQASGAAGQGHGGAEAQAAAAV